MTLPLTGTGIWSSELRYGDPEVAAESAQLLESLGFSALWVPDVGGDLFESLENLLRATSTVTIAAGILNLWMHEPEVTAERFHAFVEQYGPRVLFGIGVSHAVLIDSVEPDGYRKPLTKTASYLDAIDAAANPMPVESRVLAALGPKMLELARTRAGGSHPYLVTAEHTAIVRAALGSGPLVAPEQAVVFETDPAEARALAREHLRFYLGLPNYSNNWKRIGFTDEDLLDGGSDRLVDALVAWGDDETIARRIEDHRSAGADHVCIQVISDADTTVPTEQWKRLAAITNS
ncbi:LLM class F420-dependent oxidoreductase [soil metagenome]